MGKSKIVQIISGGMDSVVLAHYLAAMRDVELVALVSVDYGQRHKRELEYAVACAGRLKVEHCLIDLSSLRYHIASSCMTNEHRVVPEGHYAESNMKETVVPNRNMVLLSIAASIAVSKGAAAVAYGAHSGDHAIYPDCRPQFIDSMRDALQLCDYNPPELWAPFEEKSKADIVTIGAELGVPFIETWTCYKADTTLPCGRCGTCVERLEAFHLAGIADPYEYVDREFWKTVTKQPS